MRFVYDDRKAADAATFLLNRVGGSMNYIKLLALMYLSDRRTFLETGYPITGAKMLSMDKGPVLGEVYRQITWGETESTWSRFIEAPIDYEVSLKVNMADGSYLSDYERDVLQDISAKYEDWEPRALERLMRTLPEWKDPEGAALPIDAIIILQSAGRTREDIQDTAELVEGIRAMRLSSVLSR